VDLGSTDQTPASATGELVFLSLMLTDEKHDFGGFEGDSHNGFSQVQLTGNIALDSKTFNPDAGNGTTEKILTFKDFSGAKFTDIIKPTLTANADLAAKARVDFGALADLLGVPSLKNILPAVQADIIAHWRLQATAKGFEFGEPFLAFEN